MSVDYQLHVLISVLELFNLMIVGSSVISDDAEQFLLIHEI